MKRYWFHTKILVVLFFLIFSGCVEPFEGGTLTFERLLVVEAMVTNETARHQVQLSRTTPLEDMGLSPEENATITITDDQQNSFFFTEESPGTYISNQEFAAQEGRVYTLNINTVDGNSFVSEEVILPGLGQIDDVRAVRTLNENGVDGVEIVVDGSGLTDDANFFRYEFDETFQIVVPFAVNIDLILVSENPLILDRKLIDEEQRICYNTDSSNDILLASTLNLSDNRIKNFGVNFISIDDFKIRNRYSINVKQFVQSREVQSFYEALQDVSDVESLFSQTQPGFIQGNIHSVNNLDENVIGFFEVSSVTTQRIFFNFNEIFPNEVRPSFINDCLVLELEQTSPDFIGRFRTGIYGYVGENPISGTILIALDVCVDCRLLGSNVVPSFWED